MLQSLIAADGNLLLFIQENIRNPVLTPIMQVITRMGDHGLFWVILTLVLLAVPKTRKAGLCSFFALVCSYLFNNMFLKHAVGRVRPYEVIEGLQLLTVKAYDASFPSGHASASFASAVAIYRSGQLTKPVRIGLIVFALLISLSRLYVGVHYPTDVIFGVISGICCGLIGAWLCRMAQEKSPVLRKYL